jgi:peptide/nickel transport system permease protein
MKGYRKYFSKKLLWFFITFIVAVLLNFFLPRFLPGDPVAVITAKTAKGIADTNAVKQI